MRPARLRRLLVAASLLGAVTTATGVIAGASGATTPTTTTTTTTTAPGTTAGTLVGEGGSFLQPVVAKLLQSDGQALAPDFGAYTDVTLDQAISDFVGSGPNQYTADFVVSERAMTAAEAAQATKDGRGYAYVPLAATPVAIVTLVPQAGFNSQTIEPAELCQHIPLTLTDMAELYGFDSSSPLTQWSDPRLTCNGPATSADSVYVSRWANLDPSMENEALMAYLDSTPASQALFQAGLNNAFAQKQGLTEDTTPSEHWPYSQNTVPGGDQPLIGKLIDINAKTNAPSTVAASWPALGATLPISSVWTGAPLGTAWNLPTAAIANAEGAEVIPTLASATAAEADATLASTTDPTTNNLVSFVASPTDAAAYNSYLMEESYLIVPTNGLPADKATALAQLIRFAVGSAGQKIISGLGAAPATAAMVTADLKVAQTLNTEAAEDATSGTTTTTSSTTTTTTSANGGSGSGGSGGSDSSDSGSSGGLLAFTGNNPGPLTALGVALMVIGEVGRRRMRRRLARR